MRIVIDGKVYAAKAVDALSIKQAMAFDAYCAESGYPWRWTDVEKARSEIMELATAEERRNHPSALMMTALTIWASRIAEGDDVTFDDVISAPLESMIFLADPGDMQDEPDPSQDRTGAAESPDPPQARPVSGRASGPVLKAAKRKTTTSAKTSKRASIPA